MTKDEALKLALEALENYAQFGATAKAQAAIAAIKAALAQWTDLTDAQIHKVNEDFEQDHGSLAHTRAIEAKLKELNQ
jgi:20S proteasome alpha/beta subunit